MTISTAYFLDSSALTYKTGLDSDRAKFERLARSSRDQRVSYMLKLMNPETSIDYITRYIRYLMDCGVSGSERTLNAYNSNDWVSIGGYGSNYSDVVRYLKMMGRIPSESNSVVGGETKNAN